MYTPHRRQYPWANQSTRDIAGRLPQHALAACSSLPDERRLVVRRRALSCTILLAAVLIFGAPAWAAQVTICHVPPGNPSNLHTISVSEDVVEAHLAHGDFLGSCPCPCWEEAELQSVTAENQYVPVSCVSYPEIFAVIQNIGGSTPGVEGGFAVYMFGRDLVCTTRDLPPFFLLVTPAQADVCEQQIRNRCEAIGTPIP
jgi:hypothetical protein